MRSVQTRKSVFSIDNSVVNGHFILHLQCLILQLKCKFHLKCYYGENHVFSIEAILRHKQVACMRRKMLFTIFKYLFSFQRYSSF